MSTSHQADLIISDEAEIVPNHRRIKDVGAARGIYERLYEDDKLRSEDRARVQRNIDGARPYSQSQLDAAKMGDVTNVNFLYGAARLQKAMGPIRNMLASNPVLLHIPIKTGDKTKDSKFTRYFSRKFTDMLRRWDNWTYLTEEINRIYNSEGVSVVWFADDIDWRFRVVSLKDFKVPASARASTDGTDIAAVSVDWGVSELYRLIADEDAAKDMNINVDEAKKAILAAAPKNKQSSRMEWEDFQEKIKNNDLYWDSISTSTEIIYMWERSLSGKVTQYIFSRYPGTEGRGSSNSEDFISVKEDIYDSLHQAFIPFTYSVGTNGTIHSIRGLSWMTFTHDMLMNRMMSAWSDAVALESRLAIQPMDESGAAKQAVVYRGPLAILPPGQIADRQQRGMGEAPQRFLSHLDGINRRNTGHYEQDAPFQTQKERTRIEVASEVETHTQVQGNAQLLFELPLEKTLQEIFRRVQSATVGQAGWGEIRWFLDSCEEFAMEHGSQPGDASSWIRAVSHLDTKVNKDIGGGSAQRKEQVVTALKQNANLLGPVGRANAIYDWVAMLAGYENADRWAEESEERRMPLDFQIAEMQNFILLNGLGQVNVEPSEDLVVHAGKHVEALLQIRQSVDEGQMDIADAAMRMQPLHEHATETMEMVAANPATGAEAAQLRQALQQVGEIMVNGLRKARAQRERDAGAQKVAGQGGGQRGPDLEALKMEEAIKRIEADQERLAMQREKHQIDMQIAMRKSEDESIKNEISAKAIAAKLLK